MPPLVNTSAVPVSLVVACRYATKATYVYLSNSQLKSFIQTTYNTPTLFQVLKISVATPGSSFIPMTVA